MTRVRGDAGRAGNAGRRSLVDDVAFPGRRRVAQIAGIHVGNCVTHEIRRIAIDRAHVGRRSFGRDVRYASVARRIDDGVIR
jgi:hypothetical protein